ncbi:MAG: D-alanyl-D-alanine carboxypeptidase/D-alanyl-D-alanine endopeptidase [Salibacteraceae bacterium]
MKQLFYCTIFLFLSFVSFGQKFQSHIEEWTTDADLKNAAVSVHLVALKDKQVMGSYNSELAMIPASNLKLLTTAAALNHFGSNHTFNTSLYYTGEIVGGELLGDLVIKGGGDPTLGSKLYGGFEKVLTNWVKDISEAGIMSIKGRIIADASILPEYNIARTWIWEDMGNYYGAGVGGIAVYDNTYYLSFKTAANAGELAQIVNVYPEIEGLTHDVRVKSSNNNSDNAYIFGGPYRYDKIVEGTLPKGKSSYTIKGSMPDPALFLVSNLKAELKKAGIKTLSLPAITDKDVRLKKMEVGEQKAEITLNVGKPLSEIIKITNQKSNNLFAETLHRQLGLAKFDEGSPENGNKAVMSFLNENNIYSGGVNVVDGSGMSRFNTVTTQTLTDILVFMNSHTESEVFKKSLSEAGVNGTLRSFLKGSSLQSKVMGKSGYMERVRSYSGYATIGGEEVVFSIIVNNYSCSAYQMKKKIEALLLGFNQ